MIEAKTVVTRVDDVDGTTGDTVKTRRITIDVEFEASDANFGLVQQQVKAALPAKARPAAKPDPARKAAARGTQEYNRRVREWANGNGYGHLMMKNGRPSKALTELYVAATNDKR